MPDEGCILETAKHLANNLKIEYCKDILKAPIGNPSILVTIIFSIFYFFLAPLKAYKAILIFQSLITSSLLFPLYKISKEFLKNHKKCCIISSFFLFIPQLTGYENTVMSEPLFAATNIWLVYFYIQSFQKKQTKNKIYAFILGIIAAFLRPFGFITLVALTINEIIVDKSQRILKLSIFLLIITILLLNPNDSTSYISNKIFSLVNQSSLETIFTEIPRAIINQFNSLNVATLSIPMMILIINFKTKTFKIFEKIKYFILIFIITNLLISAQHSYGYFLAYNGQPDLIFRYINVSIIYVLFFGLLFLFKKPKFELTNFNILLTILIISLIFLIKDTFVSSQLIHEYSHTNEILKNFFNNYYVYIALILLIILISNRNTLLITTIFAITLGHSSLAYINNQQFSSAVYKADTIYKKFKDSRYKILHLTDYNLKKIPGTYWSLSNLTENYTENVFYDSFETNETQNLVLYKIGKNELKKIPINIDFNSFDYIISSLDFDLPIYYQENKLKVYKSSI